jgi:hypothetical protein
VQLRDNWWIHTQMPTVTVEPAYLSNTREAALIGTPGFQQLLAMAIRSAIERYDPEVLKRKAEIVAWNAAHPDRRVLPTTAVAAAAPASGGSGWLGTAIRDAVLLSLIAAVVRWPVRAFRVVAALYRLVRVAVDRMLVRRAASRRRRRAVERRATAMRAHRFARPHHIYDELF